MSKLSVNTFVNIVTAKYGSQTLHRRSSYSVPGEEFSAQDSMEGDIGFEA